MYNAGGKCREEAFWIKQHPTGFIGSADDITFSIGKVFKTIPRSFMLEISGVPWVLGSLWEMRV